MVESKKNAEDIAFDARVKDVLDWLGQHSVDEENLVIVQLNKGKHATFVENEVKRMRVQASVEQLQLGLRNAGLLDEMSDQDCRDAISAVEGGEAVNDVVSQWKLRIETRKTARANDGSTGTLKSGIKS